MKQLIKGLLNGLSSLLVIPMVLGYWAMATFSGRDQAIRGFSQLMSLVPGTTGAFLRRGFYGWTLPQFGKHVEISFGTIFSHSETQIGNFAYMGPFCTIGKSHIGEDVLIGSHVSIMNGTQQHGTDRIDIPMRLQPGRFPEITVGRDTWIGDRAVISANVGSHCIIGAGSVVLDDVPDYCVAVGCPARIIRNRKDEANGMTR